MSDEQAIRELVAWLILNDVHVAIAFCIFWLYTLHSAMLHFGAWLLRTIVVAAYTLFTFADQRPYVSNAEWIASFMVGCHWLGCLQAFIYPDPRFRRTWHRRQERRA